MPLLTPQESLVPDLTMSLWKKVIKNPGLLTQPGPCCTTGIMQLDELPVGATTDHGEYMPGIEKGCQQCRKMTFNQKWYAMQ